MPVNARTATDSGLRFYTWNGVEYPSVTTLRRLAGMPFGLAAWQVNQVINAAIDQRDTLAGMDEKSARKLLRSAATKERDAAADKGTRIHEAASLMVPVADAPEDEQPYLTAYYHFIDTTGAKVLSSERQVYNLTLGYAGSYDLLLEVFGARFAVDIKTGKNIYPDHALQLMGYTMAEFVGEHDVVDKDATAALHSINGMAILHIGPGDWEWVEVTPTRSLWTGFQSLCQLAHWLRDNDTFDALVTRRLTS